MAKESQWERLYRLLNDFRPHRTDEILREVYGGDHLGLARVAARIGDIKAYIPDRLEVVSWKDKEHHSLTWYHLRERKPVDPNEHYGLFQGMTGESA